MEQDTGASALQTGCSRAEPVVSALRASPPCAADILADLIANATDEDLADDGRYFSENYDDLTKCGHGDTGEYQNTADGKLVEFLWNNRRQFLDLLREQVSA